MSVTCRERVVMFRWLADVLRQSRLRLGLRFVFTFTFRVRVHYSLYDWTWHNVG